MKLPRNLTQLLYVAFRFYVESVDGNTENCVTECKFPSHNHLPVNSVSSAIRGQNNRSACFKVMRETADSKVRQHGNVMVLFP